MKIKCKDCGAVLTYNVVGLNKKLVSLDTTDFLCLECLSNSLGCTVEDLKIKIEEFREQGCTLFS